MILVIYIRGHRTGSNKYGVVQSIALRKSKLASRQEPNPNPDRDRRNPDPNGTALDMARRFALSTSRWKSPALFFRTLARAASRSPFSSAISTDASASRWAYAPESISSPAAAVAYTDDFFSRKERSTDKGLG